MKKELADYLNAEATKLKAEQKAKRKSKPKHVTILEGNDKEQQRRDEKHGLYGEHEDVAN